MKARSRAEALVLLASAALVMAAPSASFAKPMSDSCFDVDQNGKRLPGKSSPGLICQIDYEDRDYEWGYTNIGQICNFDQRSEVIVHCPLLRSELTSKNGLACAAATLVYQQGNGDDDDPVAGCGMSQTDNYSCVLASVNETGWSGWWWGHQSLDQNGFSSNVDPAGDLLQPSEPGVYAADWHAMSLHSFPVNAEQLDGGGYYLSCSLPPVPTACGGQACLSSLKWWERRP